MEGIYNYNYSIISFLAGTAFPGKKTESSYASKSTAPNVGGGEFHTGPVVPIRDLNPYNG